MCYANLPVWMELSKIRARLPHIFLNQWRNELFRKENTFFTVLFIKSQTILSFLFLYNFSSANETVKVHLELMSDINEECKCHIADFNYYSPESLTTEYFIRNHPFHWRIFAIVTGDREKVLVFCYSVMELFIILLTNELRESCFLRETEYSLISAKVLKFLKKL